MARIGIDEGLETQALKIAGGGLSPREVDQLPCPDGVAGSTFCAYAKTVYSSSYAVCATVSELVIGPPQLVYALFGDFFGTLTRLPDAIVTMGDEIWTNGALALKEGRIAEGTSGILHGGMSALLMGAGAAGAARGAVTLAGRGVSGLRSVAEGAANAVRTDSMGGGMGMVTASGAILADGGMAEGSAVAVAGWPRWLGPLAVLSEGAANGRIGGDPLLGNPRGLDSVVLMPVLHNGALYFLTDVYGFVLDELGRGKPLAEFVWKQPAGEGAPIPLRLRTFGEGDVVGNVIVDSMGGRLKYVEIEAPEGVVLGKGRLVEKRADAPALKVEQVNVFTGNRYSVMVVNGDLMPTNKIYMTIDTNLGGGFSVEATPFAHSRMHQSEWPDLALVTGDQNSLAVIPATLFEPEKICVREGSNLHKMIMDGRVELPKGVQILSKGAGI